MAITTNWSVEKMDADNISNAVYNVHINLTATDGTNSCTKKFVVGFVYQEGDPFIPYNELTEEIVLGWVTTKLGDDVAKFEQETVAMLSNTSNLTDLALPW